MNAWLQNYFYPKHKEKYLGNKAPFYKSSWELKLMNWMDLNQNVIAWNYERVVIPYKLPIEVDGTGRIRRYFVDFYCEIKCKDGIVRKYLVEVKPLSQSVKPKLPKSGRVTPSYKRNAISYIVNQYKWKAAEQYCKDKGYEWKVLTEREIYNMNI